MVSKVLDRSCKNTAQQPLRAEDWVTTGWRQLAVIALAVAIITAAVCHPLVRWLHIRTGTVSHRLIGESLGRPRSWLAGSSLTGDGIAWDRVCTQLVQGMETWFVAGSSPYEWEPFQNRAPNAQVSFIGVSAYDLNEEYLCDFRSQIVPLRRAVSDLVKTRASWEFSKRVLSQYPLKYIRILFPTAGRSQGVMGGLKEEVGKHLRGWAPADSEMGPTAPTFDNGVVDPRKKEKISAWQQGRLLQRLAKMKTACFGRHSFEGPKKLALLRILNQAQQQGRVFVVVLPVSPAYQKEFLTRETARAFETSLASLQKAVPQVTWVRLDQVPELNSDDNFWDVVHMNVFGQQIATDAFLRKVGDLSPNQ
jgi:hypothetical protein